MATIMAVEDSRSTRRIIVDILKMEGHTLIEAEDGVDALEKAMGTKLDLVISDVNMPNMGGIELVQKLREQPTHRFVPILMVTTESAAGERAKGKAAGATAWIVKPFDPRQFIKVVEKVLR